MEEQLKIIDQFYRYLKGQGYSIVKKSEIDEDGYYHTKEYNHAEARQVFIKGPEAWKAQAEAHRLEMIEYAKRMKGSHILFNDER